MEALILKINTCVILLATHIHMGRVVAQLHVVRVINVSGVYSFQLQGQRVNQARNHISHGRFLHDLFFDRRDGPDIFLRNVD
jgi:hypothetical protein